MPGNTKRGLIAVRSGAELLEATNDTIIYHLETIAGGSLQIDLYYVLKLLLLFWEAGFIPPLPQEWINQAARAHRNMPIQRCLRGALFRDRRSNRLPDHMWIRRQQFCPAASLRTTKNSKSTPMI
jgi:hypothetical protein